MSRFSKKQIEWYISTDLIGNKSMEVEVLVDCWNQIWEYLEKISQRNRRAEKERHGKESSTAVHNAILYKVF